MQIIGSILIIIIISSLGYIAFRKWGILDKPGQDLSPREPVPNFQGLWLIIGFLVVMAIFFHDLRAYSQFLAMTIAILILFLVSMVDDFVGYFNQLKGLPSRLRLILQLLVLGGVVYGSGIYLDIQILGINLSDYNTYISIIFCIIRIGLFINSINRFDGYNLGLSTISTSIGFLTIYLLINLRVIPRYALQTGMNLNILGYVADISMILFVISIIGFVLEYKPMAVVRDAGIMFLGFMLGYLSLLGGAKIGIMMTALSLPLLDSIRVVINRIKSKKSPLQGDRTHLHYRLLALGWSKGEIRSFVLIWSLFFMILSLLQGFDTHSKITIFIMMSLVFFGVNVYIYWIKGYNMHFKSKSRQF